VTSGKLVGIARVYVASLRNIPYEVAGSSPVLEGRATCVLDKVVLGDHDGHAALEYSESLHRLTPKQKGIVRQQINGDIAEAFGEVIQLSDAFNINPSERKVTGLCAVWQAMKRLFGL
jgi:hypothetical protein